MNCAPAAWPDLNFASWRDTAATLQLWTQIVGKVRLQLTPWVNHSWQVPLYVTARGLGTSPIPFAEQLLEIEFDFLSQQLLLRTSAGAQRALALEPRSVADFYVRVLGLLHELGVLVSINDLPSELEHPVRFPEDHVHASYDAAAAQRFWRVLVASTRVFSHFRSGFLGKVSPVHFFWGSFDLAVTRFSGRRAPLHPGGVPGLPDAVAREAYSHEVSSAGFWPGNDAFPHAAFYSYAYPEPRGIPRASGDAGAHYEAKLGEFVLPYEVVRASAAPEDTLLEFLSMTYAAAADCGGWDRAALECSLGVPAQVRAVN